MMGSKGKPYDICFFGLKCYGLLANDEVPKYLGGIERNLVNVARGLANVGIRVAFITFDEGQDAFVDCDGVHVYRAYASGEGLRGIRLVHPKMTRVWQLMSRINARVYLCMGAGIEAWIIALACKYFLPGSRSIFCVASDDNTIQRPAALKSRLERLAYVHSLPWFDVVISQTEQQRQGLKEHHNIESSVIPMPRAPLAERSFDEIRSGHAADRSTSAARFSVLWIGRWVAVKRLEWLLDLASQLPEIDFQVVGKANQGFSEYTDGLNERAAQLPNVRVHGKVTESELIDIYQGCQCLINTSIMEGFPTTFLEAWSIGMPCITTFDPDGIVASKEVGWVAADLQALKSHLVRISNPLNAQVLQAASERSKRLFDERFSMSAILPSYKTLIQNLAPSSEATQ